MTCSVARCAARRCGTKRRDDESPSRQPPPRARARRTARDQLPEPQLAAVAGDHGKKSEGAGKSDEVKRSCKSGGGEH